MKVVSVHRSVRECHISNAIWELLNIHIFDEERFTWDGEEGKDDVFYTPLESLVKENNSYNLVVETNQTHL